MSRSAIAVGCLLAGGALGLSAEGETGRVEITAVDAKRRVSRAAVKFFQGWVKERASRVKLDAAAETFWKDLLDRANAE
jgi:hypothetical protein